MGHHFYSKRVGLAILALPAIMAMAASIAPAQSRKKEKGPRALAVVELPAEGKSKPRLIPLTILVDGRFWDASIYLANPRPMALEPGNVYEVERSGKPLGFFTVVEARSTSDRWFALGDWQPESERPRPATKPALSWHAGEEDRPVLHRQQASDQAAQPASPSSSVAAPAPASSPAPSSPPSEDSNRPVLRHGKPKPQPEEPLEEPVQTVSSSRPVVLPPDAPFTAGEMLPAISDEGGPEPRSYTYAWAPEEQLKLTKAVSDIAMVEITSYAKGNPALRYVPTTAFDHIAVRVFDLNTDNNPEVVFTARVAALVPPATRTRAAKPPQPVPDFFFYVTVVGQNDLYGQMRKLFSSVTDSAHLDTPPRLELIDAVDAEGTGHGNLLFSAWSGATPGYQLYHVGPDSLRKLFDSAGH